MQRIPVWGVLLIMAGALGIILYCVATLRKRYKARWPW